MAQVRKERRGKDNKSLRLDLHRYVFLFSLVLQGMDVTFIAAL